MGIKWGKMCVCVEYENFLLFELAYGYLSPITECMIDPLVPL